MSKMSELANDQETIRRLLGRGDGPSLLPNWHGSFKSYDDWVNRATRALVDRAPRHRITGSPLSAMCVDMQGRPCFIGADFMRARDEGAFPVYYFFDCLPEET
jgi:hypothetical protein